MSVVDEAKEILDDLGLSWPGGDPGKLREAADAWRAFAESVDDVRTPVNKAAKSLIHHNKGEAIDAFEVFWGRYVGEGDNGWLQDIPKSARSMAKALDQLADAIDDAVEQIWNEIIIGATVIAAGFALGFVTFGAGNAAGVAAAEGVIAFGATMGVTVSGTVARIAAGVLVGYAFGGVESVALELAVAQPMRIATGQQQGFSLDQVNEAAKTGSLYGGVLGGGFAAGMGPLVKGPNSTPPMLRPPALRADLVKPGPASRCTATCPTKGEPVDVATGALLMQQTDVSLPASLPLLIERTHMSSYRAGTYFGPTWISTLDEQVQLDSDGVVFAAADGMRLVYPVPEPDVPVLPSKGARWPLEWDGKPDGVLTITDPDTGVVRTFAHPAPTEEPTAVQLPLESWQDRNGARIEVERTARGIPTALRHSGGYCLAVDTEGPRVTALRLLDEAPSVYEAPGAPSRGTVVMRYGYDEAGNLAEVINSSGKPLRFTYDDEGRMLSWTDRNGTSFAYEYDEAGRVVRTEGSEGIFNGSFAYDEAQTTTYTDSLGHRTSCRYNEDGQVVEETDPLGHTTYTAWDERGTDRLSFTDALGRTTRYAYDDDGNLTDVTLPDGSTAHAAYNSLRQPVDVTEPGGTAWRHAYDELGNLTSRTEPDGAESHYAYDDRGHLTSVTDALGHERHITCDAAGLPATVTDTLSHTTRVRRDTFGRVVEITDPLGHTIRMGWTTEGKPSWRQDAEGNRESWTWDGEGNLLTHTDPAGHVTRHTSAHFDVPATRTDPDGATYAFAYDTELRLTEVTSPQGLSWTYEYDAAGHLTSETDFDDRTLIYALDPTGDVLARTNGAGETLHYTRDVLGRTVEQRDDSDQITTYTYDASGHLTAAANVDAEVTIERDALGRVLAETVNSRRVGYAYDQLGRRARRTTPSGLTSEWTYDAEGRPLRLSSSAGTLTFGYDAAGRETERRVGDGVTLAQTWDAADRITTQTVTSHGRESEPARVLQHRAYAYRPDGYLTEIRELTSGTRRFDLDPMGRVTGVQAHGWNETYRYDTAGNLTQAAAPAHESPGDREFTGTRIRTAGRTSYEHDAQGRLVRRTRKLLNGQAHTWTYTWNAQDQLTAATTPDGDHWAYTYDPLGRRLTKQRTPGDDAESDTAPDALTLTFTWDGTRLAEQATHEGRVTTWDYAPGTHSPLTQTDHKPLTLAPGESRISQLAHVGSAAHPAPLPRDHHRPRRHPHRTGHPRGQRRSPTPHHPLGHPTSRPTRRGELPPPLPGSVRRPRNRPPLQLLPSLRPRNRPLHLPGPLGPLSGAEPGNLHP